MNGIFRRIATHTAVYGIGGACGKVLAFVMVPVMTRLFLPEQFGRIELLTIGSALAALLMMVGMDSAQSYFHFKIDEQDAAGRRAMLTATTQFVAVWGGCLVVVAAAAMAPRILAGGSEGLAWLEWLVAGVSAYLGQLAGMPMQIYRLLYQPWRYTINTLASTALGMVMVVVLVLHYGATPLCYFTALAVASVIVCVINGWQLREVFVWRWHGTWWPRLLRFGLPLVPAGLVMYAFMSLDRWLLAAFCSSYEFGIYAVAAKFTGMMNLLVTSFRTAWWPLSMELLHKTEGPRVFRIVARGYIALSAGGVILVAVAAPWLMRLLTTPPFYHAYPIIPLTVWTSVMYGFYLICGAGMWRREQTWLTLMVNSAGVLGLLAAGVMLVPRLGGIGAAAAAAIGFFVWNAAAMIVSERQWQVGYNWRFMGAQIMLAVCASTAITLSYRLTAGLLPIMSLAAAAVLVLLCTCGTAEQWRTLVQAWKHS